jgi:hypothetical protein
MLVIIFFVDLPLFEKNISNLSILSFSYFYLLFTRTLTCDRRIITLKQFLELQP